MTTKERQARDAARRARRWQLCLGILSLVGCLGLVLATLSPQPPPIDPGDRALWSMRGLLVLVAAVMAGVRLGTAIGIGRLRPWAWWTAASFEGLLTLAGAVAAAILVVMHPSAGAVVAVASASLVPYWTIRRLFDHRLVRWFNPGREARQVAGPDPRFDWDAAPPLMPGGRMLEGYVPSTEPVEPPPSWPAPSGGAG